MKRKLVVAAIIGGGLASPLALATNGYFSQGYSMKEFGMAGAGIALPQDSLAAATNPAGMVMVGDRFDIGLEWFKPNRSATITGNGAGLNGNYDGNGRSNFFIPNLGYNRMVSSDMSLGVSVYGNGGMNTQYNTNPFAAFGAQGPAGVNLQQLFVSPTWAMKVNPSNSIGVSLNLVYQTFAATGLQPFAQLMSSNPGAVTNQGTDTSTGVGVKLGWTGEITPMVALGATYQPKTKMSKFSKYAGLFADAGNFDIPATYGAGIAVKATPATTVAFDVQKIQYSGVPSVGNMAFTPAAGKLGAANGMGFGWQDVTVYKLGISQKIDSTLTVRGGYSHNNQPIQNSQTLFNILAPGVITDHLTLGATWMLADKSEVTVGYMHAFKKTVNGSGSIPPGAPAVGGFGGGEANLTMSEDAIGVSYGW